MAALATTSILWWSCTGRDDVNTYLANVGSASVTGAHVLPSSVALANVAVTGVALPLVVEASVAIGTNRVVITCNSNG